MALSDTLNPWRALREAQERVDLLEKAQDDLIRVLRTGHYRNPATGRLGRKGELFEVIIVPSTRFR